LRRLEGFDYLPPNIGPGQFGSHPAVLLPALPLVLLAFASAFVPWIERREWRASAERRFAAASIAGAASVVVIVWLDPG